MKTFRDFLFDIHDIIDLEESSLSRIKSKSDKKGIATLSADRGNKSRKENQKRSQQLQKDIRSRFGRGPTKLKGSYIEKDEKTGKERKVKEKSYAIDRGKMSKRKFKKEVKKLGRKYGQDSVLTQTKKTGTLHATRKKGLGPKTKGAGVGKFSPQKKNPQGQSQIKGKIFSYS